MNNKEAWSHYKDYTRDVTEHSRKLGFAGAAICWFFKENPAIFPIPILYALAAIILFFVCDICQNMSGALLTKRWLRREEIKKWKETEDIEGIYEKPGWIDYPSFVFFNMKIVSLITSFLFIGWHIFKMQKII